MVPYINSILPMVPLFFNEHDIEVVSAFFIVPNKIQTRPIFPHEDSTRKNLPNIDETIWNLPRSVALDHLDIRRASITTQSQRVKFSDNMINRTCILRQLNQFMDNGP